MQYPCRAQAAQSAHLEAVAKAANEHLIATNQNGALFNVDVQTRYGQLISFFLTKLSQGELVEIKKKYNSGNSVWEQYLLTFIPKLIDGAIKLGDSVNTKEIEHPEAQIAREIASLKDSTKKIDGMLAFYTEHENAIKDGVQHMRVQSALNSGAGFNIPSSAGQMP